MIIDEDSDDFYNTWYSFGFVLKGDVKTIEKLKDFIKTLPNKKVIYSKTDIRDLYIISKD